MPETRNPAVEKLVRWVIYRATRLMIDAARWKIVIDGKGDKCTCSYTVYEDP